MKLARCSDFFCLGTLGQVRGMVRKDAKISEDVEFRTDSLGIE